MYCFNGKRHFLHAGFCTLARGDLVAMRQALERYSELDYSFQGSREHQLLEKTTDAYENYDLDAFSDTLHVFPRCVRVCVRVCVLQRPHNKFGVHGRPLSIAHRYSYDKISKLNPWETSVLLKVKQAIEASASEDVDLK